MNFMSYFASRHFLSKAFADNHWLKFKINPYTITLTIEQKILAELEMSLMTNIDISIIQKIISSVEILAKI